MQKSSRYFDTHRTKICKDIYRPSSNLMRFAKSVLSVFVNGQSPISNISYAKRRLS